MSRKKGGHSEEHINESWLLPYSDLMTLLLAVFIVLFAVSTINQTKAANIAESFGSAFGMFRSGSGVLSGGEGVLEVITPMYDSFSDQVLRARLDAAMQPQADGEIIIVDQELIDLQETMAELQEFFEEAGMDSRVTMYIDERGLVISLADSVLFDPGRADIRHNIQEMLIEIASVIDKLPNIIRVEGHTDNVPIHNEVFPSNWELSSARAARVVRLFITAGVDPEKLTISGYGEFRPVAENETSVGRALNRRVDIIVLSSKYDSLERQSQTLAEIEAEQ